MGAGCRIALVVAGLGLVAAPAHPLDTRKAIGQYGHDVWQMEQGLPQLSVQAILQTQDGYLWLGTQEGLVRFDGVRFTVFSKANAPALRSNFIQALCEGRDGSLWIGTGGGGLTRLLRGRFTTYTPAEGLPSEVIWSLHEDHAGKLWIGSSGGGLAVFDGVRFTVYTTRQGLGNDTVFSVVEDSRGAIWAGTDGGGLSRFERGTFTTLLRKDGLPSDTINALYLDRSSRLWIGTGSGLARLEDGRPVAQRPEFRDRVTALLQDRDGGFWAGTEGGGLARFADGPLERFASRDGLSNDSIRALLEDHEGSLWIGTRAGGLNRLKDGRVTTYTTREGLASDIVWSVLESRDGAIWIATDGGGLSRYRDRRFTTYTTRDGLPVDMVRSLLEDSAGVLWVGTWGGGLARFEQGRFRTYGRKDGLPHEQVRAVYEDRAGDLWIGTYGGGLARMRGGRFTTYTTRDGLGNDTVYCIHQDRAGDLWVGTRGGGLSRLRHGAFTTFTRRDGLPDDVILSLHEDAQGALWIGTTGGLARLKAGRFGVATSRNGLDDDVVYRILEDDAGHLWMSSNHGISKVSRVELERFLAGEVSSVTAVSFGKADGMKSPECNGGVQPAGFRSRDGRLWFPTARGLAVIDPRHLRRNTRPPPVVVERVSVDGHALEPTESLRAEPGRRTLEFHYTALSFLAPEKVRFRYRLEGFDRDWVDAGTRREAYYTNIPPGSYAFRVIACNDDGVWNETGATLRLELEPHFHETRWFRVALGLAAVAAGAGLVRLRLRSLEARQRELVRLVDERTKDLRDAIRIKAEVLSIVAHDFRSPLTLIQGYGELLLGRAQDADTRRLLQLVTDQARYLAALAADTLTASRIETGQLPIELEDLQVAPLVRSVVEARAGGATEVGFESQDDDLVVRGDPARIRQVLENLVGNAVKYGGARVRVAVRRMDGAARISVADDGPGIPPEEMPKLFLKFSRLEASRKAKEPSHGLGLYICRSIVEAHGGRIWAESEPGHGSTFHVALPVAAGPAAP